MASDRSEVIDRVAGRVAVGSVYQCYHGDDVIPQVVLEWRPPERVVVRMTAPVPGGPIEVLVDYTLAAVKEGTRLTEAVARLTGPPLGRAFFRIYMRMVRSQERRRFSSFGKAIEADHASRSTTLKS